MSATFFIQRLQTFFFYFLHVFFRFLTFFIFISTFITSMPHGFAIRVMRNFSGNMRKNSGISPKQVTTLSDQNTDAGYITVVSRCESVEEMLKTWSVNWSVGVCDHVPGEDDVEDTEPDQLTAVCVHG